jgi:hypothetical protein
LINKKIDSYRNETTDENVNKASKANVWRI